MSFETFPYGFVVIETVNTKRTEFSGHFRYASIFYQIICNKRGPYKNICKTVVCRIALCHLFSLGGMINGSQGNSFEVYNPITDKWKFLSPPVIPRSRHSMVSTETHLYVIGGEGHGFEPEISMERYDPAVDLWSFILPMNCGKVGACAVELEGKIYVMGGNNGYTTLRQCEIYDIETHQWTLTKGKMTILNPIFLSGAQHSPRDMESSKTRLPFPPSQSGLLRGSRWVFQ